MLATGRRALRWLACASVLVGCGDAKTTTDSAQVDTSGATDSVQRDTASAVDVGDPACPNGALGCPCGEADACARGQCVSGVCSLCTRGEVDCLCRADGSCGGDLLCKDGLCRVCPPGSLGCACEGGACDEGGSCVDGACAAVACAPGSDGCPCRRQSAPPCDGALACLGDGVCHACAADRAGCACAADDTCQGGLLCDGGACRAPRTCADLVAEGYCGEHQACAASAGSDAECVADECQEGYVLDGGRCVEGRLNCASDKPGSILDACTSQLRHCVEAGGAASCGGCIDDASLQDGVCVGRITCGATSCLGSEYCDASTGVPSCQPLPCAPGEAKEGSGACRACNFTCSGAGLSGRVWPFRTNTGTCVCETTPGFFMPPGGDTRAAVCDVDGDGWVREEVEDPALTSDPALVANARCDLVKVDTVLLRDELGVDAQVVSCREGLLLDPEPTQCTQRIAMPLVESLRNDTPGPLVGTTTPAYGGRRLDAREANALTKACVSALGDFNDDGVEDLLEVQTPPARLGEDPRQRLASFAYFVETHRAYVERGSDGKARLVIEERYRCDPSDFPLHYDPTVASSSAPADAYVAGDGATYWRSCTRGADPRFDPNADPPVPGFDFAQWSCPKGGAGCTSIAPGPPHPSLDLREPIPFGSAFPEDATLCELGSRFPRDGVWRGMGHESQFKCLGVGDGPGRRPLTDFGAFGPLRMNLCEAVSCAPGDASCAESRPVVPGSRSLDPILRCRAIADVATSDVGFAAVRYAAYGIGFGGGYQGGCVSEDTEYHDTLCPDPVFTVSPADDAFGANTCHVAPCPFGKADCDGNPLNGCELDATNNVNCGGCGVACAPARGVGDCSTGLCRVTSCQAGWEDCDHDPKNGCERSTRTLTDCGACNVPCAVSGGAASCATGACKVANCGAGVGDCDAVEDCETPLTTNTDCGACGVACAPKNGTGSCATGACQVTACAANFDDCDHDAANGCESSLSSATSCGGCGKFCLALHSVPTCTAGTCTLGACYSGYGNCDGDPKNDCERQLTSLDHCGQCNHPCSLTGANVSCSTGTCALTSCQAGRANCDANDANGCEVNLASPASCGAAEDLGSFNADTKCGIACAETSAWEIDASKSGRGSAWFKVRQNDFSGICSADLRHRIKLQVPTGVDYDIVIWDQCGGTELERTTGAAGVDETLEFGGEDTALNNDSFNYWIEVRFNSGSSCQEWSLSVEGRKTPC